MHAGKNSAAAVGDVEIVIARWLDAPRSLVWRAFTSSEDIVQWWGPNGFTTTTHRMAFQVGGLWQFTMHGPDGTDYPNWIRYTLIDPPARIEYDHGGADLAQRDFAAVIALHDEDGGTRVVLRLIMPDRESRDAKLAWGVLEGGVQTLARLEAFMPMLANATAKVKVKGSDT